MAGELAIARRYLLPPSPSFWNWDDGGEAISWNGGSTIAFRAELVKILRRLAPERMPPLSSLLLVLAATRDNWHELPFAAGDSTAWGFPSAEDCPIIASLFVDREGFAKLRTLDSTLRSSVEMKTILAEVIFDTVDPAATPGQAAIILQYLEFGIDEVLSWVPSGPGAKSPARPLTPAEMYRLRRGIDALAPESLQLRRRTSLDQLPQAADLELSRTQQVRGLLGALQNDEELQGLARLARDLMAAVSLPRAVSDSDELQLGGVSDITNRGPLDRLLLTELVYDDLTLAVRVNVNEALYLRRESPPRTPERARVLLLDAGIRSWGVPRVFATAVALAMAATSEPHIQIAAYRAAGAEVVPVDLLSREGLVDHLEALQPEPHPGDALEAFVRRIEDLDCAAEPVIVTTEDVLADREFCHALATSKLTTLHLATVNREGDFRLVEKNERGRKQIRQARLNLETLFCDRLSPRVPPLIHREWTKDLPAIFSVAPFPLLLPYSVAPNQMIHLEKRGVLGITKDGRLMHWHQMHPLGAVQVNDDLPPGGLQWYSPESADGMVYAVMGGHSSQPLHLLRIRLDVPACQSLSLDVGNTARAIAIHNGVLLVLQDQVLMVLDVASGEILEKKAVPSQLRWRQDRFFRDAKRDQWFAAGYDGRSAHLEPVFDRDPDKTPWLFSMFECEGVEGPIGITRGGDICYTATGEIWKFASRSSHAITNAWHHGSRVVVRTASTQEPRIGQAIIDVVSRTVGFSPPTDPNRLLHPTVCRYVTPRNVRHRFTSIGIEPGPGQERRLVLTSRKQKKVALQMIGSADPSYKRLRLVPVREGDSQPSSARPLKQLKVARAGFALSRAEWPDGSEAFVDCRGLLHLRSSNRHIPEVTVVLSNGDLGGWCSDGRLWGDPYYTGQSTDLPIDQLVYEQAIGGFIRSIP